MKYFNLLKSALFLLAFSLLVVACGGEETNAEYKDSGLLSGVPTQEEDSTVLSDDTPGMSVDNETDMPADDDADLPADEDTDVPVEPNTENDPPETNDGASNNAGDKLSDDAVPDYGTTKEGCYLKVSFYSKGAGIDGKTQGKFDEWIKNYQQKYTVQLAHSMKPWGREGEIDYCFKMTNMTVRQRRNFIDAAKKQVGGKELVRIETALK